MSTELGSRGNVALTQFWGGDDRGVCLQLTSIGGLGHPDEGHVSVDVAEAQWLRDELVAWLASGNKAGSVREDEPSAEDELEKRVRDLETTVKTLVSQVWTIASILKAREREGS